MAGGYSVKVTGQVTGQVVNNQAGQTLVGTEIFFVTGDGNEGSVFIPDNHYKKDLIQDALIAQGKKLDDVGRIIIGTFE